MTFTEITQKKVGGVPVVYLAAGASVIHAVVAWRMKASPTTDTPGTNPADGTAGANTPSNAGGLTGAGSAYDQYDTNGTVVVAPSATVASGTTDYTNDMWVRDGIGWLVANKHATTVDAAKALNDYVNGSDLSYDESALVNAWSAQKQAPETVTSVGAVSDKPAQRQFATLPGTHTVTNANDNTLAKIAQLYYGNADALHVNRIAEYNTGLGPASATLSPGTRVVVPGYANPYYYTVTGRNKDNYPATIAGSHGISVAQLQALNPTLTPPYPVGTKVRTQ